MGAREARNSSVVPARTRPGARTVLVRAAAVLLLALGGLFALGLTPALAAPAPTPVPGAPYGGALDAPEPGTTFDDEQLLEVGMLALGSVNGLAFVGVVILSRFRGHSAEETRRALINRTAPGAPSGERRRTKGRATTPAARPAGHEPEPFVPVPAGRGGSAPVPPIPHQGGAAVPTPRPGAGTGAASPTLRPAAPRR